MHTHTKPQCLQHLHHALLQLLDARLDGIELRAFLLHGFDLALALFIHVVLVLDQIFRLRQIRIHSQQRLLALVQLSLELLLPVEEALRQILGLNPLIKLALQASHLLLRRVQIGRVLLREGQELGFVELGARTTELGLGGRGA